MQLLHTADWHLGSTLLDGSRKAEYEQFFDWLIALIRQRSVDALLICGDIYDSANPSAESRRLYSSVLSRLAAETDCRYIILTAGNHDSPSQLEAEAPFLSNCRARVVSRLNSTEDIDRCLIPLSNAEGQEELLLCALPFLRAGIARSVSNDTPEEERRDAYLNGVRDIIAAVAVKAASWKAVHPKGRVIAMAHQAIVGARPTESTRSIIGTLDTLPCSVFGPVFDYVALGHIHHPWAQDGGRICYSGSPLPMGMDEADFEHKMRLIRTEGTALQVENITVPRFVLPICHSCRSAEELDRLPARLAEQAAAAGGLPIRLELAYEGHDLSIADINERLRRALDGDTLFRVRRPRPRLGMHEPVGEEPIESLADYAPDKVFEMRLRDYESNTAPLPDTDREMLRALFGELLHELTADRQHEPNHTPAP